MSERKIKIEGREVTVFKMTPEAAVRRAGRRKHFERLLIESLRPGEATDVLTANPKAVYNAALNAGKDTGKTFTVRREGKGVRVFCTGRKKSNVLQLRKSQIAA